MILFKKLALFLLILTSFTLLFAKSADDKFKNVEIKTIKVKEGIYMLMGRGGNIGVFVGKDGVFMIDDQFAPLSKKIKMAIKNISKKPIKFLINTHWHFDHTGGNENFGKDKVVIVSHDNVRKRMSKDNFIKAFNKKVPKASKIALPIITFNDNMTFFLNDEQIEVIHKSNAHTDGDSIIFFKTSNVIHTGDIYFNGFYPFIDSSSKGSLDGVLNAVDFILSKADKNTKIIPGHGKLSNKQELIKYKDMLIILKERMEKLIKEGKSLEEILILKPTKDLDDKWGKGFLNPKKFTTILYSILKK